MNTPSPNAGSATAHRKLTVLLHLDFILTGVVMILLGPLLPILSARWGLSDSQAGHLFTAQFVSSTVITLFATQIARRYGHRFSLVFGLILMSLGVAGLAHANAALGLACVCIYGVGHGMTTPVANLLIAEINPTRKAAALNLLNSSWGIGAMGCPFLVAAAQKMGQVTTLLYGITTALLLLAVWLVATPMGRSTEARTAIAASGSSAWKNPFVVVIGCLLFVYVGCEVSVGGWMAMLAERTAPLQKSMWALMPSFFYGAMLLGRALAPLALRRRRETTVAVGGLVTALVGIGLLLLSKSLLQVGVGATLAGLGFSSIFPISISLFSRWFGAHVSLVAGVVFAGGNLGGGALPWLVGALSTHFDNLKAGFLVPFVGCALLLIFYLVDGRAQKASLAVARS